MTCPSCTDGVFSLGNTSCVCNTFYTRPLDFNEQKCICENILPIYSFTTLLIYTFTILFTLTILAIITVLRLSKTKRGFCVNSIGQFTLLLAWSGVKIIELALVHVFNRHFIACRALFWISQLLGSIVHALELSAYVNFYQSSATSLNKKTDVANRIQKNRQESDSIEIDIITPFNMHDTLCLNFSLQYNTITIMIASIFPALIGFFLAILLELSSFIHLIYCALIMIVFCCANLILSILVQNLLSRTPNYKPSLIVSNTNITLLLLSTLCGATALVVTLVQEYFTAEVLIAITEVVMFIRFGFVFFYN